jgi:hypothetical protein
MKTTFRILDTDHKRARRAEAQLRTSLKAYRIEARVHQVFEHLEFSRRGLQKLPALEFNGIVISQGQELSGDFLDDFCSRFIAARKKIDARKPKQERI